MPSQCLFVLLQSRAAHSGKAYNGSDCDNWRERRGSMSSSLPVSSSSSSSASSSPSSPPPSSAFPAFATLVNRSRDDKARESRPPGCFFFFFSCFAEIKPLLSPCSSDPWLSAESFPESSGYFEGVCSSRRASTCSQRSPSPQMTDDLPDLLCQLGLFKYIDVFEQQEVILRREVQHPPFFLSSFWVWGERKNEIILLTCNRPRCPKPGTST